MFSIATNNRSSLSRIRDRDELETEKDLLDSYRGRLK